MFLPSTLTSTASDLHIAMMKDLDPPDTVAEGTPESAREPMFMIRVGPSVLASLGRRALVNCAGNPALTLIKKLSSSAVFFSSGWTFAPPLTLLIRTVKFRQSRLVTNTSIC